MKANLKYLLLLLVIFLPQSPATPKGPQEESRPEDQAQLLSFKDVTYPGIARVGRVQGVVVVKAKVDESGNVIATSALLGPKALADPSMANIKEWKFKPKSGDTALIVFEFQLDDGACHDASHSLFRLVYSNFAIITACNPVLH